MNIKRLLAAVICIMMLITAPVVNVSADEENLVFNNGTMDGILSGGSTERVLNGDWTVSYPVATFGGSNPDSPGKVKNIDGNNVVVLEHSTGTFASFFADLYANGTNVPAGEYELSMDLKPVGEAFTTDNIGYNLYGQYQDIRIYDNGWKDCTELEDGWLHYSRVFTVNKNSVDSIQMWFNTMNTDADKCALYVDNLCFKPYVAPAAPSEIAFTYTVGSDTAISVTVSDAAETVVITEKGGYVLESGVDYTYADGIITLENEYANGLASGINELTVSAGDSTYIFLLTIMQAKPALPESNAGYLMQETLVGGDFEIFEEGFKFSMEQVEGWGSNVSYDDPAVVVSMDGNKVLRLQKDIKSSYSSAFAFISPTIQAGDVLTLSFDYCLDVQDISTYQGADINFCFVSASNMQMFLIPLDNSCPNETRGDGDYQWEVEYTELENNWMHVEATFVANTALLSYNSMRFLLPTDRAQDGDAMYIDNVSLVLWAEPEAPEYYGSDLSFDKAVPAEVFAMVDLKALDPSAISCDGTAISEESWSVNPAKDTITISKDYLATLSAGNHTFTVKTAGGTCDFTVTVTGETTVDTTPPNNTSWIWIALSVAIVAVVAVVVVIVVKKKKGKAE